MSALEILWSYFAITIKFDSVTEFLRVHENSIWQGNNSCQSFCKISEFRTRIYAALKYSSQKTAFSNTTAHSCKNLSKDLCSCSFWCSDLRYNSHPSFPTFLSSYLKLIFGSVACSSSSHPGSALGSFKSICPNPTAPLEMQQNCEMWISFYKLFNLRKLTVPGAMIYLPINFPCYLLAKQKLRIDRVVSSKTGNGIMWDRIR